MLKKFGAEILEETGWEGEIEIELPFAADRGEIVFQYNDASARALEALKAKHPDQDESNKECELYKAYTYNQTRRLAKLGQEHLKGVKVKHTETGKEFTDRDEFLASEGSTSVLYMVAGYVMRGAPLGKS